MSGGSDRSGPLPCPLAGSSGFRVDLIDVPGGVVDADELDGVSGQAVKDQVALEAADRQHAEPG